QCRRGEADAAEARGEGAARDAGRFRTRAGEKQEGPGGVRILSAESPARVHRMDHQRERCGYAHAPHRASRGVDRRRKVAELEVRAMSVREARSALFDDLVN